MGSIQTSIQLFNGMTPMLQSMTNALNITISSFEQMQRVSGTSIDTAAMRAAREELRGVEATIAEMEEALMDFSRTGRRATRSLEEIGLHGVREEVRQTGETVQRQTNTIQRQTGLLQRGYAAVARELQSVVQRNERVHALVTRVINPTTLLGRAIQRAGQYQQTLNNRLEQERPLIDAATAAQGRLNGSLAAGRTAANGLLSSMKGIVGAYFSIRGMQLLGRASDSITSVVARLDLINDGLQTTQELSDKILKTAFETGADYVDTAAAISKMGLNAGAAFQSNDELIAFMDQVNKSFAIGGASATEQSNAMLQLTQAMAAGALRGEELNSILEGAPGIARNIEKYMGWAEGSIKQYAQQGLVTASVVKNAMLSMAEETNAAFQSMPTTISGTFSKLKTLAIKSFTPVLKGINGLFNNQNATKLLYDWGATFQYIADRIMVTIEKLKNTVNSEKFQKFAQDMMTAFTVVGAVITWLFDTVVNIFNYVVEHWDSFQPVLTGIAVAMGVVTATQWAWNIAMYACPITWIVIIIGVIIVLLYVIVDKINKVKNTTISATGIIAGVLGFLGTVIYNVFAYSWNIIATFINFLANVFQDPISAIKVLFLELLETVLGVVATIAKSIAGLLGKIPHLPERISLGLERSVSFAEEKREDVRVKIQEIKDKAGFEDVMSKLEYKDMYGTAERFYNKAAGFAQGLEEQMEAFDPFAGVQGVTDMLGDILDNIEKTAGDTNKIANHLERDKEDLEFLRNIATMQYGDKYVMPQVKVEMTNHNTIQSELDLDGFFDRKLEEIGTVIQTSAEGVHI